MKPKSYFITTFIIFLVMGLFHLARLLGGWHAQIDGVVIPLWLSWTAVFLAVYLAFSAFRLWMRR